MDVEETKMEKTNGRSPPENVEKSGLERRRRVRMYSLNRLDKRVLAAERRETKSDCC